MRTQILVLALLALPLFAACDRQNKSPTASAPDTTMQKSPPAAGMRQNSPDQSTNQPPNGQPGETMQQPPAGTTTAPGSTTPNSAPSGSQSNQ